MTRSTRRARAAIARTLPLALRPRLLDSRLARLLNMAVDDERDREKLRERVYELEVRERYQDGELRRLRADLIAWCEWAERHLRQQLDVDEPPSVLPF